jgi:quinolinate synthase
MPVLNILGPTAPRAAPPPVVVPPPVSARALPMPSLEWNEQVAKETAHLYERVKTVIPAIEWPFFAPYVKAINALKKERNAVILAHNYQTPEIYNCVADFVGDSLQLAIEATRVKAESDICCTSSNAVQVVESLGVDKVIMLPDQYLARYVASQTDVKIIMWKGACEVHERFTGDELRKYRADDPGIQIIAHPECPPDVIAEADFTGSTAHMIGWVRDHKPRKVVLVTECSMASNVKVELPDVEFVQPCNLCPHMKRITLPKILESLCNMTEEVTVDPLIADKARRAVERMIHLKS